MDFSIGPRGRLQFDHVRLRFKNFSGTPDRFTREGDRSFHIIIDDPAIAEELIADGWNVKIKEAREEGELPSMTLKVKVNFTSFGPNIYLQSGDNRIKLDEESVSCLDNVYMLDVSLDVDPHNWEMPDGRTGKSAYLHSMLVEQEVDRFASYGEY